MTLHDSAHVPQKSPTPDAALKRLDIFVGKWVTEGQIKGSPSEPVQMLKATDTYEWLAGGFFLVHHVDGHMGDDKVKAIELIGYDAASQSYFTHSYDNQGSVNTYQANLLDLVWTIAGKSERFHGVFSADGKTLSGSWELLSDGSDWVPWMDIKLTKVE